MSAAFRGPRHEPAPGAGTLSRRVPLLLATAPAVVPGGIRVT
ncbi:hypothetical protein [Streptomyces sp. AF1A]